MVEAPQAGFLSDDNLWFWLALFGPWKNKIQFSLSCTLRWRQRAQPSLSFPITHGYWMFPKEKKKIGDKPSHLENNADLRSLSEKSMKSRSLHARCSAAFLPSTRAMERSQEANGHEHSLLQVLLSFPSPSSTSYHWNKLGASLSEEIKL